MIWRIVFLFSIAVFFLACQKKSESLSTVDRAQELIDRGQYEQAISDLNAHLVSQPNDQRARVVLASCYVRRAGLTIADYFQLEKVFSETPPTRPSLINMEVYSQLKLKSDSQLVPLFQLLKILNDLGKASVEIAEKFQAIPNLNSQQAQDLDQALNELEKITVPQAGPALYRGVLKTVMFKIKWNRGDFVAVGDSKLCTASFGSLQEKIGNLQKFLDSVLSDLKVGLPKSRPGLEKKQLDLATASFQVGSLLQSFSEHAENLQDILSQALGEDNTLQEIKCEF